TTGPSGRIRRTAAVRWTTARLRVRSSRAVRQRRPDVSAALALRSGRVCSAWRVWHGRAADAGHADGDAAWNAAGDAATARVSAEEM
ncbi:hypothetical protein LTR66_014513, partial [Elasticomyces elasticus]